MRAKRLKKCFIDDMMIKRSRENDSAPFQTPFAGRKITGRRGRSDSPSAQGGRDDMTKFLYRGGSITPEDGPVPLSAACLFEKLVTIAIFREPWYAYLSKMVLEGEGITCFVCDEYTCSSHSIFSRSKTRYRLQVRESVEE
jgi:hypothetical protein